MPRLTPAQHRALSALASHDERHWTTVKDVIRQTDKADRASGWREANVDRSILTMMAKGWIANGRRYGYYEITPKGRAALETRGNA